MLIFVSSESASVFFVLQKCKTDSTHLTEVKKFLDMLKYKMWVDLTNLCVSVYGTSNQLVSPVVWLAFYNIMLYLLSRCQQTYTCKSLNAYSTLMSDVVHGIPPELLGALLHEELTEQRDRQLLCEGATGGSLAFIPFSQSDSRSQNGCLLYAGNQGLDKLSILKINEKRVKGRIGD